jgi:4-methylaminobutanoate oxidase (formaldehyde-forming)
MDALAAEHAAFRERAGIADLTSFGKLAVSGPGALPLLERVCDNRIDRPAGSVVYTQMLNPRGGIVADVTVTRLGADRFRIVTGAAAVDGDLGWLRLHVRPADGPVALRDETDELAVIGLWGPRARDVLAAVSSDDVGNAALPFRTARTVDVGGAAVLAQRISFAGELGFELYVAPEWAVQVWDRLTAAGREHGLRAGGYRVLDSLRIEKGYRVLGTDLTAGDTPYEAGVGFCVAEGKDFVGAGALAAARRAGPRRRLRTLVVGGGELLQVYGGEAVRVDGEIAGRVRSAAYGFTAGAQVALASLPPGLEEGAGVVVEVLGEPVGARVAPDVLHDPEGARLRA